MSASEQLQQPRSIKTLFFIYIDAVVSGFYDSVFIEMCSHFDNLNRKKETL